MEELSLIHIYLEPWPASHYIGTLNQICVPDDVREKDYDPASGEFTDPGYVQALEYYQQRLPYMTENPNGVKPDMGRMNFSMGTAGMYFAELIEIPYITAENPEMEFGMFKFPPIEGAAGNANILTGAPEGFVVCSKTKYPDECVEFLKWFLGTEVGTEQCQETVSYTHLDVYKRQLHDSCVQCHESLSPQKSGHGGSCLPASGFVRGDYL